MGRRERPAAGERQRDWHAGAVRARAPQQATAGTARGQGARGARPSVPVEVVEEGQHVKAELETGLDGVVLEVVAAEHVCGVVDAKLAHAGPVVPPEGRVGGGGGGGTRRSAAAEVRNGGGSGSHLTHTHTQSKVRAVAPGEGRPRAGG